MLSTTIIVATGDDRGTGIIADPFDIRHAMGTLDQCGACTMVDRCGAGDRPAPVGRSGVFTQRK